MRMKGIIAFLLLCFFNPGVFCFAADRKKKEIKAERKIETEYDKLFGSKKCKTVKGLITLHKIDGKVYFEFPLSLMEREMLLGSTVEEISDNMEALVGQKPHTPLHIYFTKIDSAVQMRYVYNVSIANSEDVNIQRAIDEGNIGAIVENFPIKCWNNDKTAVVFDVTKFFVSDRYEIDPFDPYSASTYYGWMQRISNYKSDRSFVGDIWAFDDNIAITSHLSYGVTMRALGMFEYQTDKPFTAIVKRSLVLLPENPMRPRIRDPRIGIFYTGKAKYTSKENRVDVVYYANRWRLEPQDMEAYKRGELTEVKKPIVFYVDNNFPEAWLKSIWQGIEDWNMAFEKIGFKNVMQAKMFPVDDPEFDPNNIKYSCIRYAPLPVENAMGPSWVDPRSGEILNASVFVYHNVVSLAYNFRMLQTAAVDPAVRAIKLPDEVMADAIRYIVRHEIGHCLGLMHNMGASNAFPTDSLRSASFTRKYGTTPSIMDYARFNYVAQPGDLEKGVKLTPPVLGVYDYYAIRWAYQPIPEAASCEEEMPILDRWISEKAGDPMYRYGKQQIFAMYDPRSLSEDLGDDAIKSVRYGVKNLKYVLANYNSWVEKDDEDLSFRYNMYLTILQQYTNYLSHVQALIGGIYLNEIYEGDPMHSYQAVPKEKQRQAVRFLMELSADTEWLENKALFKKMSIIGNPGILLQKRIVESLISGAKRLALSNLKSDDPYTEQEYLQDIFNFVWKPSLQGKTLKMNQREAQISFVNMLISNSGVEGGGKAKGGFSGITNAAWGIEQWLNLELRKNFGPMVLSPEEVPATDVAAVGFQRRIRPTLPDISHVYYDFLLKTKVQLEKCKNTGDQATRDHYGILLHEIGKAMKIK